MTQFHFHLPSESWVSPDHRNCTMATDTAGVPVPNRIQWKDDSFSIEVLEGDAARIMAMVQTEKGGAHCLATGWLFPKWSKYSLELEILRATLYRYRIGCTFWESAGLPVPDGSQNRVHELTKSFIQQWKNFRQATEEDKANKFQLDITLLHQILSASDELTSTLIHHQGFAGLRATDLSERTRITKIHQKRTEAPFRFGLQISPRDLIPRSDLDNSPLTPPAGPGDPSSQAVSSLEQSIESVQNLKNTLQNLPATLVSVSAHWNQHSQFSIEDTETDAQSDTQDHLDLKNGVLAYNPSENEALHSAASTLKDGNCSVVLGPMIRFGSNCLPADISPNADGIATGMKFGDYVTDQLKRQKDLFQIVHIASGINGVGVGGVTPTAQFNILTEGLEAATATVPKALKMISFQQPLGERLAWSVGGQSATQVLAKLAHQRTPLDYIGLELDIGFFPQGTLPRDPLSWVMNLQRWSVWNVPIMILLRVPSAKAKKPRSIHFDAWGESQLTPENQFESICRLTELFSSLPWVHGVMLADWKDNEEFPSGGVCYENLRPKPWLAPFSAKI